MALAFWALRRDFDPFWWAPNAALLVYPWLFFGRVVRAWSEPSPPPTQVR